MNPLVMKPKPKPKGQGTSSLQMLVAGLVKVSIVMHSRLITYSKPNANLLYAKNKLNANYQFC